MDFLLAFNELKQRVLVRYREEYPSIEDNWKTFSSKDISQLIDSIQAVTQQRVSEKWIYTHLKPAENLKLPRKDMLDILSVYAGFDSWDAFIWSLQQEGNQKNTILPPVISKKNGKKRILSVALFLVLLSGTYFLRSKAHSSSKVKKEKVEKIPIKDYYTKEVIQDSTIQLYVKKNGQLKALDIRNIPKSQLADQSEVVVKSPYYAEAKVEVSKNEKVIVLKPDNYAMRLKAFMQTDIKDWKSRKVELDKILSDNLEVLLHLENNLGIEYMNKTEFSQKLIIPTKTVRSWQIISLEQDSTHQITKIRIAIR